MVRAIAQLLPLDCAALPRARQQLLAARLIAYQKPLYQVLALDPPRAGGGPLRLGQVLQGMERAP